MAKGPVQAHVMVKAVSEVFAPVAGDVSATNGELESHPGCASMPAEVLTP